MYILIFTLWYLIISIEIPLYPRKIVDFNPPHYPYRSRITMKNPLHNRLCQLRSTAIFGQDHMLQPTQRSQETWKVLEKVYQLRKKSSAISLGSQNDQDFSWDLLFMKVMIGYGNNSWLGFVRGEPSILS